MASFYLLTAVYILGGITFIPLLLCLALCHAYLTLPTRDYADVAGTRHVDNDFPNLLNDLQSPTPPFDEEKPRGHARDVVAGYFAVCREYVPGGINGKPPERTTPAGAVVSIESPSVYQTMYRSIFDRNKSLAPSFDAGSGPNKRGRNVFYVVLRHGHLMLYDDSEQLEVRHVISLANYDVDVYAGGAMIPEGELWIKRNCVRLIQRRKQEGIQVESKPYYIFSENCSEKEDFYHAVLRNNERPADAQPNQPSTIKFEMSDLIGLVQQLHASDDNMYTRWINALIGRLFLALYKTAEVENFIYAKISKKIARVPKPNFIRSIQVQRIDMGNLPPSITNPRLKELSTEGDLIIEADLSYKGNFRLDISAIARIELGTRFKAREVTLVLASILKRLDGHVLLRIKPPPSNRLWFTFERPPRMELSLEPIVSSRQITYGVILRAIESRIREVVADTLVFPNWDDIPFSDTMSQKFRGGIFDNGSRKHHLDMNQLIKNTLSEEADLEHEGHADGASTPSSETTKGTSTSDRTGTTSSRRFTQSSLETTDESVGMSSATDLHSNIVPKAMQSRSFSSVASPVVDVKPVNALASNDQDYSRQNAATAMKSTMSKSPSTSPVHSPVGSPQQPASIVRRTSTPSVETELLTQSNLNEGVSGAILMKRRIGSSGQEITLDPTSTNSKDDMLSQPSSSSNTTGPLGRRPTLNQSLVTATAVAKKWLSPRQASAAFPAFPSPGSSNPTPIPSPVIDSSASRKNDQDVSATSSHVIPTENGRHRGPIGRGQPLPPPGTPLPRPPPLEKRSNWSVPAASTLVNLTRRRTLSSKQPMSPSFSGSSTPIHSPKASVDTKTQADQDRTHDEGQRSPRKTSSASSLSGSVGPPPLPKRRQRLSIAEPTKQYSDKEQILVVEAPDHESSEPTSPAVVEELEQNFASNWNLTDEHETVFQEMDVGDNPS